MLLFYSSSQRAVVSSRTILGIFLFFSLICVKDVDGLFGKSKKAPLPESKSPLLKRKGKWKNQPSGIMVNKYDDIGIGIIQSNKSMKYCAKSDLDKVTLGFNMVPKVIMEIRIALDNPSKATKKLINKWFGKDDKILIESLREKFHHIDDTFKSVKLFYRGNKIPDVIARKYVQENYLGKESSSIRPDPYSIFYVLSNEKTVNKKQMLMFIGGAFTGSYTGDNQVLAEKHNTYAKQHKYSFAGSVFHEMTHWYLNTKDNKDVVKFYPDALNLAKSDPSSALKSAHNWQFFFDEFNKE